MLCCHKADNQLPLIPLALIDRFHHNILTFLYLFRLSQTRPLQFSLFPPFDSIVNRYATRESIVFLILSHFFVAE